MPTKYDLKYLDKFVTHEGFRSKWDSVYFKLLDQEISGKKNIIGDFEYWWDFGSTQGYPKEPTCVFHINYLKTGLRKTCQIYCYSKKRKNALGDRERYRVYELSHYNLKISLGEETYKIFNSQIEEHKKVLKKNWDIKRKIESKKELEEVLKNNNITATEYKRQKAAQRLEARQKRTAGESVERTKRILLLAPLLGQVRDEVDVILKQYNSGRGNFGRPDHKAKKLKEMLWQLKYFKSS